MSHPSDGEAWKHFDQQHPQFSSEPRNVRLGLCTDGFQPFGQFGTKYSCWPFMVTPYNLPPWLCMKRQFIFLSLMIPGLKNPKQNLDIYLQPLVKELKELWSTGLFTYDDSRKQNFILRAALLWTINDFPAYGMLSGWTTAGEHACPYCMENETKSFWLKHGKKWSWFDCHRQFLSPDHVFRKNKIHFRKDRPVENDVASTRLNGYEVWECVKDLPKIVDASDGELKRLKQKRIGWWKQSIFWELPYWKTMLIRHNLDVMHIEKIFFEQLINALMDVKFKTCFNSNSVKDLNKVCKTQRKADSFVLKKEEKKALCDWRFNGNSDQTLSFPDWLRAQVSDLKSDLLVALAMGPSRKVRTWKRYSINWFNFRVFKDGKDVQKSSINNGVCVNSTEGLDYYGTLNEVIELCYTGKEGSYRCILFKCDWIDNSERGMNVHKEYKLVDVNRSKKYPTYDPFVLAHQVEQVCFAPYPNTKRDKDQWSAVFKTQARSHINAPVDEGIFQDIATSEMILSVIEENEMGEEELEEVEELVIEENESGEEVVEEVEESENDDGEEAENDDGEENEAVDDKDTHDNEENDDDYDDDDEEEGFLDDLFPDNNDY
ncbi:uncharacterized protein LOC141601375 [Silene latifolia]|uniref:uncharacterized protein LOC141601375 n=1 Tax=Silene latifolia TaxID=37657 RepID=UPI003D77FAA7